MGRGTEEGVPRGRGCWKFKWGSTAAAALEWGPVLGRRCLRPRTKKKKGLILLSVFNTNKKTLPNYSS